ncbi:2-hydroxyisoflavanone dehydratase-like [Vigna radiata var. radiata]|uniref:2-hydroxyisoflavanone dehydratase-like n=1 Tax=Vigna radiata var. radiata TaxID=3916 RepID=A0A1S3VPH2_VIGRR|nr:2-hydroxyisoflavanone dehydratase-like [Vigna radiata var. radiata]
MTTMEIPNFVRVHEDGTIERLQGSPFVPPKLQDPTTNLSSKDVVISDKPPISARLYLPNGIQSQEDNLSINHKLPILVYFHGGGFFFESAFSQLHQNYFKAFLSVADILVVAVEYRLAPETPLPAAYHDCWEALKWVATKAEPWVLKHGDFDRVFVGGDSAGANIAHNIAMRAGAEALPGGVTVLGALVSHPFFLGSERIGSETEENLSFRVWKWIQPCDGGGFDNPLINPLSSAAASLSGLGCRKLLVCTAGVDELRERGLWYYEAVKKSGWKGKVELYEVDGEDHVFHVNDPETQNAHSMFKRFADFIFH